MAMPILVKIILIMLVALYFVMNFVTAKIYNSQEMKRMYIDGQCTVGMICTNAFYAPAWILKFLRCVVLMLIK